MPSKSLSSPLAQAELILHLYELRRETVMREARSYIGGSEFLPASADELVAIVTTGGRKGGFVLQVFGYWDIVAAFVRHGALDAALVYDTCQEMYFQYAKIQPHLAGFRKQMNLPEWMSEPRARDRRLEAGTEATCDDPEEPRRHRFYPFPTSFNYNCSAENT